MLDWIKNNWVQLGIIAFALHTLLKAIARTTKTAKDDSIVEKISKIIGYLFGKDPNA